MLVTALWLMVLQLDACGGAVQAQAREARRHLELFDMAGAATVLEEAAMEGCEDARVPALYLRGLAAARAAYAEGGSPESLVPVRQAAANLESLAGGFPGSTAIAREVLVAAAAAAQSERPEMRVYLEHAMQMEALQFAAQQPGAPFVSAHEAAGNLWLQVHQYEEARNAYIRAKELTGSTPGVMLGLARVGARTKVAATACAEYRSLLEWWGQRPPPRPAPAGSEPAEIEEARTYVGGPACSVPAPSGTPPSDPQP